MIFRALKLLVFLSLFPVVYYLILPSPVFPPPPPGSLQSNEPADTESTYRRAYFTNLARSEIMEFYDSFFRSRVPIRYRLDLPREDAYSVIRDQTASSYLEEIIHPWRESLYVNVFVPTHPTEQINRNNVHYLNKITVRFIPSHPASRLTVLLLAGISFYFLAKEYARV